MEYISGLDDHVGCDMLVVQLPHAGEQPLLAVHPLRSEPRKEATAWLRILKGLVHRLGERLSLGVLDALDGGRAGCC